MVCLSSFLSPIRTVFFVSSGWCCGVFHTLSPLRIAAYRPLICCSAGGGSPRCPAPDKSAIWKSVTNTSMCGRSSGAEPSSSHPPGALIASIILLLRHGARQQRGQLLFLHWASIDSSLSRGRACAVLWWWWWWRWVEGNFPSSEKGWMSRLAVYIGSSLHRQHTNSNRQQLTESLDSMMQNWQCKQKCTAHTKYVNNRL